MIAFPVAQLLATVIVLCVVVSWLFVLMGTVMQVGVRATDFASAPRLTWVLPATLFVAIVLTVARVPARLTAVSVD